MNIAIDMVGTNIGSGTKTYNINFCNYLLKEKIDEEKIYIFICKDYLKKINPINSKEIIFRIKSNFLNIPLIKIIWMQFIFPIELKFLRIQKLYSTMNFCPIILKFLNIKIILAIHSILPWKYFSYLPGSYFKKYFIRFFMEWSIKVSDKIIVPSNFVKYEINNILKINKDKIVSIYLGLDEIYLENKNIREEEHRFVLKNFNYNQYILSVMSCTKYHNILNIIKAIKLIKKKGKFIHKIIFVSQILDQKYFDEIKQYINDNSLNNDIVFFHNLESKFLKRLYKFAEFYIFSSYCESFGLTSIEAMSQKIPVALSNKSSLPEINQDAVIYFDPDNIIEISECINKLINDEQLRNNLIFKSNSHFKKFQWSLTVNKTMKILRDI